MESKRGHREQAFPAFDRQDALEDKVSEQLSYQGANQGTKPQRAHDTWRERVDHGRLCFGSELAVISNFLAANPLPGITPFEARSLAIHLLHRLSYLALHLGRYFCGASGKFRRPPFSILLNIIDEQLHLGYFANLRLNDLIRQLANPWIANARLSCVVDGN